MIGRFAWMTTAFVAALSPVFAWAQTYDPQMPAPYSMPGSYGPAPDGYGGSPYGVTRYTQLPDDKGWLHDDTHLERFLKETFRHAYFRLEYLNWSFSDPGDNVLGATIPTPATDVNTLAINTKTPFEIFEDGISLGDAPTSGFGVSPTLEGVKGIHNNGIRGTWGFVFEPFSVEASVFALQAMHADVRPGILPIVQIPQSDAFGDPLPPINQGTFVVQGVLVNNVPTENSYYIYDESYQATIRTSLWGADGKVVMESIDTGGPFTIQPLWGVKLVNLNERLTQVGTFRNPLVTGSDSFTRQFNAATQNYLYGPQFGARIEMANRWFGIGVEPKMMFGVNSYRATLDYSVPQIVPDGDDADTEDDVLTVTNRLRDASTTFGPVMDTQVYARVRLSDYINAFVAYNVIWAGMVTRPANNIVYNVDATGAAAHYQDVYFSDLLIQGVSVGGEVHW